MTQTTRILYVINALAAGGTERQLLYLLERLDRQVYQPSIVTLYDEARIPYHYVEEFKALNVPITTLAHGMGAKARLSALWRYVRLMWWLRPQIVHSCQHYANLITRAARPLCPSHLLLTSARSVFTPGMLRSEQRTHWLDDKLLVNGAHLRDQVLAGTGRPAHKIQVIPNGIPVEHFASNPAPGLRDQLFPGAGFVIGLVGRITEEKDHPTLLNALHLAQAQFPRGLKVFFVGAVSSAELQRSIDELIQLYALEDVICQFPVADEIASYYHAADLIVLPSTREGFPNVVLEAFAAGKPVITSAGADAVGVIEPGMNGWRFPTRDAKAFAQLLTDVWQMPAEQLARMGKNARQSAAHYSVDEMVRQYTELYATRRPKDG